MGHAKAKKRTVVADHFVPLSPTIDLFVDYHMDFSPAKSTVAAFRIGEFIQWAFNDEKVRAMWADRSPTPEIVTVKNFDDLFQYCEGE